MTSIVHHHSKKDFMKKAIFTLLLAAGFYAFANAQQDTLPVRGLCVGAPGRQHIDRFIKFIHEELAPRKVNVLVLMVNYNYQFQSHPELSDENGLTREDAQKIAAACKAHGIQVIPEIDLLGHQSWAGKTDKLLTAYPQFDETPWVKMPEHYEWPNADRLYCKSYCPLYPGIHKVIFDLIDELCDAFDADTFHGGMDEVFYIGEDKCPRCGGRDKAELFANEVNTIDNHLAQKGRHLWIWGDRLIDGKTTGIGEWEASMNNTYRAVHLINKDVTICDWHYEKDHPTPVYFAMNGLSVITGCWRKGDVAVRQAEDMLRFRQEATRETRDRYLGMMQTVWSGADSFLDEFYGVKKPKGNDGEAACFKALFAVLDK